jgi:hypothetical protein
LPLLSSAISPAMPFPPSNSRLQSSFT